MRLLLAALALATGLAGCSAPGATDTPKATTTTTATTLSPAAVLEWNTIAVDASGTDHGTAQPEQMGPGRASRAMAIVHVAMFEALIAIRGGYQSYLKFPRAASGASLDAAVARAAHDTLVALFPSQKTALDERYATAIARLADNDARAQGEDVGARVAAAALANRSGDGSSRPEPKVGVDHACSNDPMHWRPDPMSQSPLALGAHWMEVRPFVMRSADQFRCIPPPAPGSDEYRRALAEVQALGGDGQTTPTRRTLTETVIGLFWAYDGIPNLCAPPRLYNQIVTLIAVQRGTGTMELARLLALVNVSMADAGIACWDSKWHYDLWRPVCAIREAATADSFAVSDPTFTPLGAPASNTSKFNFTPPFPAYPSGHATFGGTVFQMLRSFYGTDDIAFDFVSDELNGVTKDNSGQVRPRIVRHFDTLTQAEEENGQSRIYLGIHFSFDKTEGIKQGRQVADLVFREIYRPLSD